MVSYTGINHLAMVTGDMDATIRFWRDLLGMRLVAGLGHPGYRHYFFEISAQDMLAFFEWTGAEPAPDKDHGAPVKGRIAFDHVSIGVSGQDDLWEIKARLEAAGFWASEVVDHGFIHSVYSFDPNNIAIEFSASLPGVDLRVRPVMADTQPSAIASEGAGPQPGHWPQAKPVPKSQRRLHPGYGMRLFGEGGDENQPV
ncbi:lactoylglutathione lyase-like lyase [Desulfocurvibacter africanus PCS]|uniref:Lactoylglutathione lyase-like lyase n=1 Tax=Desulfocurvibacter africanus PCS TaxID=1262666 RepID=M5PPG0_DESAF|nr:VOC family protein [Desulfocurvibacter africanus]EMG35869.1 lactoylglutathione lyase-like lyase [Desulfocurvibacter africanus PCS]